MHPTVPVSDAKGVAAMQSDSFRFNLHEFGGALGDLGTLLPLMVALILINGLNATVVLVMIGLVYIGSGFYYRLPTPVQPLKAASAIAITMGVSASVIGASGLIIGGILLLLAVTNLIAPVARLFPKAVVRGIQISIGLILLRKGLNLALSEQTFFTGGAQSVGLGSTIVPLGVILAISGLLIFLVFKSRRYPASLALVTFGMGSGIMLDPSFGLSGLRPSFGDVSMNLPSGADFWAAMTLLVLPQLPLTIGNAAVGTADTARVYFGDKARRMSPRALVTTMGLANMAAGALGGMPVCHGSGGLTAHYKLGARTGGANLMIGALLLILGLALGGAALSVLSLIPLAVLGVLLGIVGLYHVLLARDLRYWGDVSVAMTVAAVTLGVGNLAVGFGAGILLRFALKLFVSRNRVTALAENAFSQ